MRAVRPWAIAPAVVLVLVGCGEVTPGAAGTPRDASAVIRPAEMVADRESVAPGDVVILDFPEEDFVGIGYALEQEVGSSWVYRYLLTASDGGGDPGWQEAEEGLEVPAIGISDPVRVVIPDATAPGTWRICTVAAAEIVCVRIEIVEG